MWLGDYDAQNLHHHQIQKKVEDKSLAQYLQAYLGMFYQGNITIREFETKNVPFNIKSQIQTLVVGIFSLSFHHITHQYIRNSIRWTIPTDNLVFKVGEF